ncbi:MAG: Transcription-repair-coupling factor [Firmicutes bacterium ADurb.Bin193]|nr:MAG: Transcription-repair-coupling factor [Firmicutes bacterium ADurb.Bin193]
MRLSGFSQIFDRSDEYEELISSLSEGHTPVNIVGVAGSTAAHLVFCACERLSKSAIIIASDGIEAENILSDLKLFYGDGAMLFPERELIFYDIDARERDIISQRLTVLEKLKDKKAKVVVTTVSAFLGFAPPREAFDISIRFEEGGKCDIETLADKFIFLGYVREEMVEGRGQFAIRGGIVDFFPHSAENPVRVELFYDEIDSIREFKAVTQRSLGRLEYACAPPANEVLLGRAQRESLITTLNRLSEAENEVLRANIRRDRERLENSVYFPSIDRYIPFIYEKIPSLADYISDDSLIFMCEPFRISESAQRQRNELAESVISFMEKGLIPPCKREWQADYHDVMRCLSTLNLIGISGISHSCPDYRPKKIISIGIKNQAQFHGKIDLFYDAVRFYKRNGYTAVIFGGSEEKAKNIARALNDEEINAVYLEGITSAPVEKQIIVTHGEITRGFEFPPCKIAVIGDKEIFGRDRRRPPRRTVRKGNEKLNSFTDLNVGDYVVHQNHGIGRFTGIKTMTVDGATADYLHIQFRGNDSLYVPTNQLDLIFKYIGKDSQTIRLNRLGGTEWQKTKDKVRKSAADMADQLIKLYAVRQTVKGVAFTPDSDWHRAFAATFPYEETEDQLRCIDEVRADMEKDKPMDRLLCGDVGYGKTEVALRAAFKAVMDGYQVAYLVPTTILAHQHYTIFLERMKPFPVKVEMLSRFRTPKQQKDIIKRAKAGEVDIIIGTHRIVQKDLEFRNLGLLIIDEEQRFGVAHKEQLKEIRKHVDVLTLTATPIPRTLHMSMAGIRDMSVLENPPKDRYPVSTYVLEYNEEIIKEAVLREVARGGQVYYLHNRVQTIERAAEKIRRFSPNLRVAAAHGKMGENELEDIMQQVLDGNVDVLVCTTIVETGLDIPNINTIIVEDADRMGLAQLYQLRGRVGRSNRLAYAYLTYRRDKALTETAQKRLQAIRDFTEFGSGFKIALRDLEIRGAGNVLGAQQHGHMEAVGYDMYCKLLSEAVSLLKGEIPPPSVQTVISLNVNAYIPKDYIKGENYRIEIYKKIAAVENEADRLDVYDEIQDRYGNVPNEVSNLIDISLIRNTASRLGIEEVRQTAEGAVLSYSAEAVLDLETITGLIKKYDGKLLFTPAVKTYLTLRHKDAGLLGHIKNLLQDYNELKQNKK